MPFFERAQGVTINGGEFSDVAGNVYKNSVHNQNSNNTTKNTTINSNNDSSTRVGRKYENHFTRTQNAPTYDVSSTKKGDRYKYGHPVDRDTEKDRVRKEQIARQKAPHFQGMIADQPFDKQYGQYSSRSGARLEEEEEGEEQYAYQARTSAAQPPGFERPQSGPLPVEARKSPGRAQSDLFQAQPQQSFGHPSNPPAMKSTTDAGRPRFKSKNPFAAMVDAQLNQASGSYRTTSRSDEVVEEN